jgi:hypothetical protein
LSDTNAAPSASMTINGQVHRVFLHGNQLKRKQWYGEQVKGFVIDHVAVLEDDAKAAVPAPERVVKTKLTAYPRTSSLFSRSSRSRRTAWLCGWPSAQ